MAARTWVVQEDIGGGKGYIHRIEALQVKRDEPWAIFEQRLIIERSGKRMGFAKTARWR